MTKLIAIRRLSDISAGPEKPGQTLVSEAKAL